MKPSQTPDETPAVVTEVTQASPFYKRPKVRRNMLIAGSAVSLVGIGTTFAANISLNDGKTIEFGQGVESTASLACDEDGFNVTPIASYDNQFSIFRLDQVQVTGLNLSPVGSGWDDADLNGAYESQEQAKTAHPGEYFDGDQNVWKRTCDGIVIDFKAYTDDINYWGSTRNGYSNGWVNNTSSPVAWAQWNGNPNRSNNNDNGNYGFSVIFDINDANDGYQSNYGVDASAWGSIYYTEWNNLNTSTPANSSFNFGSMYNRNWRPDAASISKIAVSSANTFSSDYYLQNSNGIGTD